MGDAGLCPPFKGTFPATLPVKSKAKWEKETRLVQGSLVLMKNILYCWVLSGLIMAWLLRIFHEHVLNHPALRMAADALVALAMCAVLGLLVLHVWG